MLLLTISFYLSLAYGELPALDHGGCDVINDKLYYFGGIEYPGNGGGPIFNSKVYSLDLKSGFTLEQGKAPWEKINDNGPQFEDGNVVGNPNTSSLIIFGGGKVLKEQSLKQYFVRNNTLITNYEGVKSFTFSDKEESGKPINFSFYRSSFTANDKDPNLYYHFGGFALTSDSLNAVSNAKLTSYNFTSNSFKVLNEFTTSIHGHVANVYNNKLYIIGGSAKSSREFRKMDTILIYDFTKNTFTTNKANGTIPEARGGGLSWLLHNKMIILGGSIDLNNTKFPKFPKFPKGSIYLLDLDKLEYEEYEVAGFKHTFGGCLTYYNNHLVYSFGFRHPEMVSKTQIVDVGNWKLVQSLPKLGDENMVKKIVNNVPDEINKDKETTKPDILLIVGSSIGGFIAFAFILSLVFYLLKRYKLKRKKLMKDNAKVNKECELNPPEMIHDKVWIYPKLGEIDNPDKTLNFNTILPDFDYGYAFNNYYSKIKPEFE